MKVREWLLATFIGVVGLAIALTVPPLSAEVDISEVQGVYIDPTRQQIIKSMNIAATKTAVSALSYAYSAGYNQALEDYSIEVSTGGK
jgi:hypothetical protein